MNHTSKFSRQAGWWLLAVVLAAAPAALAQDTLAAVEPAHSIRTEPPNYTIKELAKNIVLDQKQIWTSPFRMTRRDAKWWLTFGAITGVLIATDRRSARQLPNTVDQLGVSRHFSQVGAEYTLIPIAGGAYLGGILAHDPKLRETGLLAGEALADGLIVSEVLKFATGRQRPLEGDGGGHFFHGGAAFPSGHTIGSFALASVIAHQYHDKKAIVILAYGLASVVGASRFSARQHFGSDIVAGGAIGWFIGRHVYEKRQDARQSLAKRLFPQVIPQVQPSDRSYGVLLAWHP